MVKAIATSLVVVLLVGSSAFGLGEIFQGFNFDGSLISSLGLPDGPGSASLTQDVLIGDNQIGVGVGTSATQNMVGTLSQAADAAGMCAGLSVDQSLLAGSIDPSLALLGTPGVEGQVQTVGGCLGQIGQSQGVGVIGGQAVSNLLGGPGAAAGDHTVDLHQDQAASNVTGQAAETSSLTGTQHSEVAGGPGSVGTVVTTMQAGTAQVQVLN